MLHRTLLRWASVSLLPLAAAAYVGCGGSGDDDPAADGQDGGGGQNGGGGGQNGGGGGMPGAPTDGGTTQVLDDAGNVIDPDDAGSDAGEEPEGPPVLSPSYVDYDINHVLSTGQSNATANSANPYLTTTQPYSNLMFNGGTMPGSPNASASFVSLIEGDNGVETISSGMANRATMFALETFGFGTGGGLPAKHDILVSNHGRSGWTYWCLRKGGCTYKNANQLAWPEAIAQVTRAKALADAAAKSYVVRAVTTIHGESNHSGYVLSGGSNSEFPIDGTDGSFRTIKDYADGLIEWQRDYDAMVKGITGQAEDVPLFVSQISGWTNSTYSPIAQFQLDAHKRAPGKVILVAPAYMLSFRNDCLHFTAASQRRLGEYFAKVYARVILQKKDWEPVRPRQITRADNVITVRYHVPAPPLVLDTTRVTNPGSFGFAFVDDSGATPISSVAVTGPDTVTITLASTPTGANKKLRYAQNQSPPSCVGPGTDGQSGGPRGNVRDSDATPSRHGYELFNWGVMFDEVVP